MPVEPIRWKNVLNEFWVADDSDNVDAEDDEADPRRSSSCRDAWCACRLDSVDFLLKLSFDESAEADFAAGSYDFSPSCRRNNSNFLLIFRPHVNTTNEMRIFVFHK